MLRKLDLPPRQVVIEARVLSVKLTDETRFGVNFAVLGAIDGPSALPEDDPLIVPPVIPRTRALHAHPASLRRGRNGRGCDKRPCRPTSRKSSTPWNGSATPA